MSGDHGLAKFPGMRHLFLTTILSVSCVAGPAMAGFQWTPPAQIPAPQPQVQSQAQPQPQTPNIVMEESATPLPDALAKMPDNEMGQAQPQPVVTEVVEENRIEWPSHVIGVEEPANATAAETTAPGPAPTMAQPQQTNQQPIVLMPQQDRNQAMTTPAFANTRVSATPLHALTRSASQFNIVEGFGRDLPLVMAVRQIIPDNYGYAFAEGTPLNATVSWEGGRAWDQVLYEVLAPIGYRADVSGNLVSVIPVQATALTANATFVDTPQAPAPAMIDNTPVASTNGPGFELVAPKMPAATPMRAPDMPSPMMQPVAYQSNTMTASTWTAGRDMTLRQILEKWSTRAGVELYWSSEFDYPVSSAVNIQGTFEEAVQTLLRGLEDSKPKPLGRLHPNLPNGPAVLVIETREVLD